MTDHTTDVVNQIKAGGFYALDQHDNHTLTVDDGVDIFWISDFNPALHGVKFTVRLAVICLKHQSSQTKKGPAVSCRGLFYFL